MQRFFVCLYFVFVFVRFINARMNFDQKSGVKLDWKARRKEERTRSFLLNGGEATS